MEIHSIFQTFLQSKNVETKSLQLDIGQILKGNVLDVLDNQLTVVNLQGMKVIAKTEIPLKKGQQAWFIVSSNEDDIPKLKLLDSSVLKNGQLPISELLKSMQVKDSPELRKLVSFLIEKQVPLTKDLIKASESYLLNDYDGITDVLHSTRYTDEFRSTLESVIFHLTKQQLYPEFSANPFSQMIIQFSKFPPFTEQPTFLQIQSKKKENQRINMEDVRLLFLFQLPLLGETVVQLHIYQKQMIIGIYNNHPEIYSILNVLGKDFQTFAKEKGYQTSGIQIKPIKELKSNHMLQQSTVKYQGVDIKL